MKTLIKTSIFLLVLFIALFFGANYLLKKVSQRIVTELYPRLEQKGIIIQNFDYSGIHLSSYNSCAFSNINLDFYLNKKMYGKESFKAQFKAKKITVRFADTKNPSFFFTLSNFSFFIEPEENSSKKPFGKLVNGTLKSRIPVYLKNPEESARDILNEVKILFNENRTPIDLEIEVDVLLGIDDKEVSVRLFTERIDSLTFLRFDDSDILRAAISFEIDLAEREAEIISKYPSKVPSMIKITRDAKRYSELEKRKDDFFPEDAYRHIYWSYYLSKEFGPKLAKEITDAHETIPGNTQAERQMDYHNNMIGRKLSNQDISINEIKNLVLNSGEVIRSPYQLP